MRKISNIILLILHTAFYVVAFILAANVLKLDGSKLVIDNYAVFSKNQYIDSLSTIRMIIGITLTVLYFFFSFIGQSITKSKLVYTMCVIAVILPISIAVSSGTYFIVSVAAYVTEIFSLINIIIYEKRQINKSF